MTEFNNSKDEQTYVSSLICVSFIIIYINKMKASKKMKAIIARKKMEARKAYKKMKARKKVARIARKK